MRSVPSISPAARLINSTLRSGMGLAYEILQRPRVREWAEGVVEPLPPGTQVSVFTLGEASVEAIRGPRVDHSAALLYFHGGGYNYRSPGVHRALCARLSREAGLPVWMLNYRLAPEHPFPAALDDARAAHRLLLDQGLPPERLLLAGDSAGGGLAMALLLALRDAGDVLPCGAALISPWLDLTLSGPSIQANARRDYLSATLLARSAAAYAAGQDLRHPLISPLFADLRGLPPLLIQAGEHEILRSDAERLAQRASEAGVEVQLDLWPEMLHDWHVTARFMPEGRAALAEIGAWCRAQPPGMEQHEGAA